MTLMPIADRELEAICAATAATELNAMPVAAHPSPNAREPATGRPRQ